MGYLKVKRTNQTKFIDLDHADLIELNNVDEGTEEPPSQRYSSVVTIMKSDASDNITLYSKYFKGSTDAVYEKGQEIYNNIIKTKKSDDMVLEVSE